MHVTSFCLYSQRGATIWTVQFCLIVREYAPCRPSADPEATSKFFYKHAFLGYDQLISDGFYHIRKEFTRLPSLAELEANPQLASGQVVMLVDRTRDEPLTAIEVRRAPKCVLGR